LEHFVFFVILHLRNPILFVNFKLVNMFLKTKKQQTPELLKLLTTSWESLETSLVQNFDFCLHPNQKKTEKEACFETNCFLIL
jgi:hypothetical protein